jgi:hypothetical protein
MTAVLKKFPNDDPMFPVPFCYALAREQHAPQEFAEDAARMLQLYAKLSMRERHMLHELIEAFGRIARGEERQGGMIRLSLFFRMWLANRLLDLAKLLVPLAELERLRRLR